MWVPTYTVTRVVCKFHITCGEWSKLGDHTPVDPWLRCGSSHHNVSRNEKQDIGEFKRHHNVIILLRDIHNVNKRPWAVMLCWYDGLSYKVIMNTLCQQEAFTSNHFSQKAWCLECNFLQENETWIHKS